MIEQNGRIKHTDTTSKQNWDKRKHMVRIKHNLNLKKLIREANETVRVYSETFLNNMLCIIYQTQITSS